MKIGIPYNVFLSDGRIFKDIEIAGSVEGDDKQFSFANWEGMLVLKQKNGKRIFLKKTFIRFIEET